MTTRPPTPRFLANAGAAHLIQQRDLSAEKLAGWLRDQTRETLAVIAEKLAPWRNPTRLNASAGSAPM